jgi:hypothetical protein
MYALPVARMKGARAVIRDSARVFR